MKKVFWLAPLAALFAFIGLYMHSRTEIEAKAVKKAADEKEERRLKAIQVEKDKQVAALKRTQDKEAKQKRDAEEEAIKKARTERKEEILYKKEFARRETARYLNVVRELKDAYDAEKKGKDESDKIIADNKKEKEFLVEIVAKSRDVEKTYKDIVDKLRLYEEARAKAEKAAQDAKKAKS